MHEQTSVSEWAKHGQKGKPSPASDQDSPSHVAGEDYPVLACIPDLDAGDSGISLDDEPCRSDGRILSQNLSNKLVIGGGILLVLAAILPFAMNKNGTPKPGGSEPPAASQPTAALPGAAVVPNMGIAQGMGAQSPSGSALPGMGSHYESARANTPTAPSYLQPQPPPQVGANRPMSIGDPPWHPQGPAEAARVPDVGPGNRGNETPDYRRDDPADHRPSFPSDYRRNDRGADRPEYQADRRTGAGAEPRVYPRTDRYENRYDNRYDYPGAGASQGNPLMPSPQGRVAPPPVDSSPPQPGVARLQGTIESPPLRTDYDRAGSSLH
jgi:hypothetical protein